MPPSLLRELTSMPNTAGIARRLSVMLNASGSAAGVSARQETLNSV